MAVPWAWEEAGLENLYVMDGCNGDPLDGCNSEPLDGHFCNWLHVLVEWSLPCRLEEHWIKMQQREIGTWGGVVPFAGEVRRRAVAWRKLLLMGLEERFLQRSGCLVLWAVCSRDLSSLCAIVYKCGSFSSFGCLIYDLTVLKPQIPSFQIQSSSGTYKVRYPCRSRHSGEEVED